MSGPRNYKSGTREALSALSRGYCYFPGCTAPVVRFVEGHPILNLEIAHIHAAHPGGPFYEPSMTDGERAHFNNLILLCKPHHTLVDRRDPASYPPAERRQWKEARESGILDVATSLGSVEVARLAELIEDAVTAYPPRAMVTVEMTCGPLIGSQVAAVPVPHVKTLLTANPQLAGSPLVLVATARNRGQLPVDVTSWDFTCGGNGDYSLGLVGANHYGLLNPQLPARVDVGSAVSWMWNMEIVESYVRAALAIPVDGVAYKVYVMANLGTGDTVQSDPESIEHFPWWSDPGAHTP